MNENNPSRKTPWRWLKPCHSDPHLAQERSRRAASRDVWTFVFRTIPSSLPASRHGSTERSSGFVSKFVSKATKRFGRGARQSPNPEPTAASSSSQDIQHVQSNKSSNSGVAEAEHLDPKFVNERIAEATKGVAGIGQVPTIVQGASSAINELPSVSTTIDTTIDNFSAFLRPLKAFNTIANSIANVHPYAKVALSIFTCASKMILDQAERDVAVSTLLSKISEVYTFITEEEELAKIESMPLLSDEERL
ncbi:uncharacterized protein EDB93DRAFT_1103411 [Suillus bovinus]|uniref:uncharacterized protein n=1 Tax=Suillus bovinus TaxID=48563 RepID=UPI001B86D82F|nr:uncharacterized protein EDB93DRAFT_1103411 [Suillus bovinus]KAG2150710.1 hypothetical protein EDB93DRAFT_1103411 [Suillus bovinus]